MNFRAILISVLTLVILTLASSAGRPAVALTPTSPPATVLGDALTWARTDDPVFRYLVVAQIQSIV